ncbi:hypothetical protein [Salinilacihabitans rarus]|uniref:hypothetical protein n=1 Tax=Salinilacihabitans rarus TaxID=2961596 RepID=UPI0020C85F24|nr:hypothetical protein [Salinilacihabitans rarus]
MSLPFELLTKVLVDPLIEYVWHGLTVGRIVTRLVATVALLGGAYLAFLRPAPLSYVGWALVVPAMIFTAYDALTVHRYTRH